jgi:myosin-1
MVVTWLMRRLVDGRQEWSRRVGTGKLVRPNLNIGFAPEWMLTYSLKLVEQAPPPPPAAAPRRAPPPPSAAATNGLKSTLNGGGSTGSTPASSRPNSMIGNKGPPPAPKPKPKPSIPAKPTTGAKPALAPPVASGGGGGGGGKGIGQMDLAAALAKRAQRAQED